MTFVVFKTSFLSIDVAGQSTTRHHPSRNGPKKTYLSLEEWPRLPFTARIFSPAQPWARQDAPVTHATTIHLNNPSKLACFPSLGRAPMLVYVRPSNEALLRARVPGAQDQHGCPSHPFYRGGSVSKKDGCLLPCIFPRPRVARAQRAVWSTCFPPYFRGPDGLFQ